MLVLHIKTAVVLLCQTAFKHSEI